MTTTARPTAPRIRKQCLHLLDQFIAMDWSTTRIVDECLFDDFITADMVDSRRAWLNRHDENPIVD